ncbi:FAD-dependent pyridine nucleotide-disulfide oxidoreductase [Caballeronia ptereochthonis]|uniref:FAD-dependent pyridine nucleotide-disulfide oxidoreductase n=2 Tax=Caballeronia ptereochthonis TaxID=1777144 RepID=A0A158BWP4_9BURK|nr:FAD-dependent pyridine nucleotide-disulfide oxidoreductase [Caballeronia ptereochthonis]
MEAPLLDIFASAGVRFIQGTMERIQAERNQVEVRGADGSYSAVLATGSRLFCPQMPGLAQHAFSVDQVDEAAALEAHIKNLAR